MNSTAISHRLQLKYVTPRRSGGVGETVSLNLDVRGFKPSRFTCDQKECLKKKNAWLGVRTLTLYDDRTQCSIQLKIW